jgi:hypothetical protein
MAVGTITNVAIDPHSASALPTSIGDLKLTVTTVVGSGSYTTGGDALTPANLGLGTVLFASTTLVASSGSNCSAVSAAYSVSTSKLQCFSAADSAGAPVSETANGVNVSGLTFQVVAFGY